VTWLRYLRLNNEDTMAKIYLVTLTDDERQQLLDLTSKGQTKARRLKRAQILLLANQQKTDKQIKVNNISRPPQIRFGNILT